MGEAGVRKRCDSVSSGDADGVAGQGAIEVALQKRMWMTKHS